jgi:hypothetical protein
LRAAITETTEFSALEEALSKNGKQLLVMLRIARPLAKVSWEQIGREVSAIAKHLSTRNLSPNPSPW